MSWLDKLYKTYNNNLPQIGNTNDAIPLLPVFHILKNADINIILDNKGNFLRAALVLKAEKRTIIPATEKSSSRSSGSCPHPLNEKLEYISSINTEKFTSYCNQLLAWNNSNSQHPKCIAILTYVKKNTVIKDLISSHVIENENVENLKDLFVRFSVETTGEPQSNTWTDKSLWDSWGNYYKSTISTVGLCYVLGSVQPLAELHPKNIRYPGDGAKLISSNDDSGFTFRGNLTSSNQVCGLSCEISQKAHSALSWIIDKQGYRDGDLAVVAWAITGEELPTLCEDTFTSLFGIPTKENKDQSYTAEEIGTALAKKMAGYSKNLTNTTEIVVMGVDSATPGRMAITFYKELTGSELLTRINDWHTNCSWVQSKRKTSFIGAPSPRTITEVAYGSRVKDNLRKAIVKRLLPCIIDNVPIPNDLVEQCVQRASNNNGIEKWEWEKALGVACALYRYKNKGRNYQMALETTRTSRDYLYGRLLAIAEDLEGYALFLKKEKRSTNAEKMLQAFAGHPFRTWSFIETSLTPYKEYLKAKRPAALVNIEKCLDEVFGLFQTDDFLSNKRLTGEFLLGYHCQRSELRGTTTTPTIEEEE